VILIYSWWWHLRRPTTNDDHKQPPAVSIHPPYRMCQSALHALSLHGSMRSAGSLTVHHAWNHTHLLCGWLTRPIKVLHPRAPYPDPVSQHAAHTAPLPRFPDYVCIMMTPYACTTSTLLTGPRTLHDARGRHVSMFVVFWLWLGL
jgi:hypothetical protein